MKLPCDCCEGPRVLTPLGITNRPGLSRLDYRVGAQATFFQSMQARLSSTDYPELIGLKTRERGDPSIALLDAWATVADVLTFYQERIANEGYLRTAKERRSVLELARLIGYVPRPGVSASVYLAYSIERDAAPVEIPKGARVNSVPGPGEQMQAFETAEPLVARVEWNELKPRLTRPQTAASIQDPKIGLYVKGISTGLKANDPLLIKFADNQAPRLVRIDKVETDSANDRTRVELRGLAAQSSVAASVREIVARFSEVERFDVSADAAMTQRVLAVLHDIAHIAEHQPQTLTEHIQRVALPRLTEELQAAREGRFSRLAPWLDGLVREFSTVRRYPRSITPAEAGGVAAEANRGNALGVLDGVVNTLKRAPSVPPASARQMSRDIGQAFGARADAFPRLLTAMQPALQGTLYTALGNLPSPVTSQLQVYALRVAAAPFGHNAPLRQTGFNRDQNLAAFSEWTIDDPWNKNPVGNSDGDHEPPIGITVAEGDKSALDHHQPGRLYLDSDYDIAPNSWIAIEKTDCTMVVELSGNSVVHRSLAAYGLSGKTTQINLPEGKAWLKEGDDFSAVRNTRIYAGSEALEMAEVPVTDDVSDAQIELGALYDGLEPGRWLIVAGERSDIKDANNNTVPGVKAAELAMLAAVEQKYKKDDDPVEDNRAEDSRVEDRVLPGDTVHTFITLAKPLAYRYKRDTVTIHGNVVKATHGETRQEVLGSGDAAKARQQFTLRQPPLTYSSAPTVSGVASTLEVRVNDVKWHEADSLAALGPNDRRFTIRTDDEAKTTIIFGNGERGARLPTGQENIRATYRNGIGRPGNVKAGQISLLATRPLGLKAVINPLRASGGADKESRDRARRNAPLAVMALDRLVSTQDYADFARTFAGIGKAVAARLTDGRRQLVHVTIAGTDDIPIEVTSDLYRNLDDALHRYGDPYLPIRLEVRERLALVISAKVRIHPDYSWEALEPRVRAAMLDAFSFENLELGEDLLLSNAIRAIHAVSGVVYVDVDVFDAISEAQLLQGLTADGASTLTLKDRIAVSPAHPGPTKITPAQLAYLPPEVPDTLILQALKS